MLLFTRSRTRVRFPPSPLRPVGAQKCERAVLPALLQRVRPVRVKAGDPGRRRADAPRLGRHLRARILAPRRGCARLLEGGARATLGHGPLSLAARRPARDRRLGSRGAIHAGGGRPTEEFAGFCGQLCLGWLILEPGDPKSKALLERGTGRLSGAPVEQRIGRVYGLRGGKIRYCRAYRDPQDALVAAGLVTRRTPLKPRWRSRIAAGTPSSSPTTAGAQAARLIVLYSRNEPRPSGPNSRPMPDSL